MRGLGSCGCDRHRIQRLISGVHGLWIVYARAASLVLHRMGGGDVVEGGVDIWIITGIMSALAFTLSFLLTVWLRRNRW
jgi:hypothetical protein